jgi:shikimate dehydrogenase
MLSAPTWLPESPMDQDDRRHVLIGLIGTGIGGSLSPAMHEREGQLQGLSYYYQRIDLKELGLTADALPELLTAAQRMAFTGLNITHPCKQKVIDCLDELSPETQAIGSVNTVQFKDGRSVGHNTDGPAFIRSFKEELSEQAHASILLCGAGGAGAAIAHMLLKTFETCVTVYDVDSRRSASLVDRLARLHGGDRVRHASSLQKAVESTDGFVNATPQGMIESPDSPIPSRLLNPSFWVADIVYFPLETSLIAAARSAGCRVMGGGGMAVYQAAAAFEIFTGISPDTARMRQHFRDLTAGKSESLSEAALGNQLSQMHT